MSNNDDDLLGAVFGDRSWKLGAACDGAPVHVFFPERGEDSSAAKAICARCTIAETCLEWALDNERFGVWGGTSERERRRLRRNRLGIRVAA